MCDAWVTHPFAKLLQYGTSSCPASALRTVPLVSENGLTWWVLLGCSSAISMLSSSQGCHLSVFAEDENQESPCIYTELDMATDNVEVLVALAFRPGLSRSRT
jgi:hypothetical protein